MGERFRAVISNPYRLRRFGFALTFAIAVAMLILVVTADGATSRWGVRIGGDYPAFYIAGQLAREDVSLLLNAGAQQSAITPYVAEPAAAPFPYPPLFALLLVPLTWVPYNIGYGAVLYGLAALGGVAAWLLCDLLDVRRRVWRHVAIAGTVGYIPVFRSYAGAQNGTLTLLVLVGGWWLLSRQRPAWAGLVLGALWYKPQFAVPVLLLVAVGGWRRTAAVMVGVGAVGYVAHAALLGGNWATTWYREIVRGTDLQNRLHQTRQTVSPVEYVRGAIAGDAGDVLGYTLAAVLGLAFAWAFVRTSDTANRLVLTSLAVLVTAPHALGYEAALLVPLVGAMLTQRGTGDIPFILLYYVAGAVIILPVSPLLKIAYVLLGGWFWWRATSGASEASIGIDGAKSVMPGGL